MMGYKTTHTSNIAKPCNLLLWLLSLSNRVREEKGTQVIEEYTMRMYI